MRLSLLASVFVLLGAAPVLASGGIACSSESGPAKFEVSAAMGRDFGSGIFEISGTLTTNVANISKQLQRLRYDLQTPHQVWMDRDILNFELMVLLPGNGPNSSSDLVIKTTAIDEGTFEGEYSVTMDDTGSDGVSQHSVLTGKASCIAD